MSSYPCEPIQTQQLQLTTANDCFVFLSFFSIETDLHLVVIYLRPLKVSKIHIWRTVFYQPHQQPYNSVVAHIDMACGFGRTQAYADSFSNSNRNHQENTKSRHSIGHYSFRFDRLNAAIVCVGVGFKCVYNF